MQVVMSYHPFFSSFYIIANFIITKFYPGIRSTMCLFISNNIDYIYTLLMFFCISGFAPIAYPSWEHSGFDGSASYANVMTIQERLRWKQVPNLWGTNEVGFGTYEFTFVHVCPPIAYFSQIRRLAFFWYFSMKSR